MTAIVLAAGKGRRLRAGISKPLVKVAGRPLILYSLRVFEQCPEIRDIILVVNRRNRRKICSAVQRAGIQKIAGIVLGGRRRQDSVAGGLAALTEKSGIVLIHDSARPFITAALVARLVRAARSTGAAIAGVPVKSTIKMVTRHPSPVTRSVMVAGTIDRKKLWEAQTPQAFRVELIRAAYQRFGDADVTDDAALVEKCRYPVALVAGSYANLKITTREDLECAQAIALKGKTK